MMNSKNNCAHPGTKVMEKVLKIKKDRKRRRVEDKDGIKNENKKRKI